MCSEYEVVLGKNLNNFVQNLRLSISIKKKKNGKLKIRQTGTRISKKSLKRLFSWKERARNIMK